MFDKAPRNIRRYPRIEGSIIARKNVYEPFFFHTIQLLGGLIVFSLSFHRYGEYGLLPSAQRAKNPLDLLHNDRQFRKYERGHLI